MIAPVSIPFCISTQWIVHRLPIVFGMWSTAIESPHSHFCVEHRSIECIPVLETWHHSGTLRGVYKQTIWPGKSNKLLKMHSLLKLYHDNTFWQTKYIHPHLNKFWTNKNEACMRHNPQHTSDSFRFSLATNRQYRLRHFYSDFPTAPSLVQSFSIVHIFSSTSDKQFEWNEWMIGHCRDGEWLLCQSCEMVIKTLIQNIVSFDDDS